MLQLLYIALLISPEASDFESEPFGLPVRPDGLNFSIIPSCFNPS